MTLRRFLIALFAMTGWVLAGFQAFLLYNTLYRPFDDSISLAERHTTELLALQTRSDESQEIVAWLTQYHGEAPDHQVMVGFVHWAISNATPAEYLLARLSTAPDMVKRIAFAVTDSGQTGEFCDTFSPSSSQGVKAILIEIGRLDTTCG